MEYNMLAFLLVFKMCNQNVCKVEILESPCIYTVTVYNDVKVGDKAWRSPADKFVMIPRGRTIIDICDREVTDEDAVHSQD